MKIAHIAPPWIAVPPKNYGGTEVVIYNLIEEQVAQGHDVTLLSPGDARTSAKLISFFEQSLIDAGVPWSAHLQAFYHYYKAVEYIKEQHFDIVHIHLSSAADMYIFPLMAGMIQPRVVTVHSRFPFDRVDDWIGNADQYYLPWIRSVPLIAISEKAYESMPYNLEVVGTVHHGLPMDVYQPVAQPEDFFVWLGRITPDKGTHLAIQAAKAAGVRLVLAGIIEKHLKEATHYFERMIAPEIDGDQVRYIGPVNMEQKIDLLSRAQAVLNPIMWEEPFGMVMIEAMALGCPVISFARGAAPEVVAHHKSGFLVHDVAEMIHYIPRVDELDRSVVRAYTEENFSVRAMNEKYISIYKKVISSALTFPITIASTSARSSLKTTYPTQTEDTLAVLNHLTRSNVESRQIS